ncbi:MAG: chloride channel protein [Gammaproteobacteria bacterium]|nr:chloride channel protein [Gammaproteobacteria bacterium]
MPGGILAYLSEGKPSAVTTRRKLPGLARRLTSRIAQRVLRPRLAYADPLQRLALLGVAAGAVTGVVVSLFRLAIDGAALVALGGDSENFEALPPELRAGLPLLGALVVGIALTRLSEDRRRTGVAHVLQRLREHAGRLPAANAVVQFFAGTAALAAGLSGGREGPAIHLGATASSLLGQRLGVPPDSLRILVACGAAAAIAGSFNTPMAGVVFAMEVVLLEYAAATFIPVGLAAVTATVITRYFFGDMPVFEVGNIQMHSLLDVPFVVLAGFAIGTLGAAFTATVRLFTRMGRRPYWVRALLAGAITAVAALPAPAIMGVGYDTVDAALAGTLAWSALAVILVAKMAASSACVGLGMPVGVIGPTIVIGAACGGLLGYLGQFLSPGEASSEGFYVLLGMAAMMAAALQAPLAALMAVVELTSNANIILPAMLIVIVATLTAGRLFRQPSVFLATPAALRSRDEGPP